MNLNNQWVNRKSGSNRLKNRMLIDENQMLNSVDTSMEPNSLSDHDTTLIAGYDQTRRNMSEDISRYKMGNNCTVQLEPIQNKLTFQPITISSNNRKSLLRRPFQKESQIEFTCFGDRKIEIAQSWLRDWENQLLNSQKQVQCWEIIQEVIKRLCLAQFDFQPLYVRPETFQLYVDEKQKTTAIEQCINQKQINLLFQKKKISLRRSIRTPLSVENSHQNQKESKQQIVVEVLSPDKRDIVQKIDRTKSVANLKQKISTYYYQIVGTMILISYNEFKIVDNQTKICQLPEKVLQIYQAKNRYIDPSFVKHGAVGATQSNQFFQVLTEESHNGDLSEIFASEDWIHGRLWLRIEHKKLIERYTGGLIGYVQGDRMRILDLITLIGVKISQRSLKLQFKSKDGPQMIIYYFEQPQEIKLVASHILIVTRIFNHSIANLE